MNFRKRSGIRYMLFSLSLLLAIASILCASKMVPPVDRTYIKDLQGMFSQNETRLLYSKFDAINNKHRLEVGGPTILVTTGNCPGTPSSCLATLADQILYPRLSNFNDHREKTGVLIVVFRDENKIMASAYRTTWRTPSSKEIRFILEHHLDRGPDQKIFGHLMELLEELYPEHAPSPVQPS